MDHPKLNKNLLVDLGGWTVLKEARGIIEANAVKEVEWVKTTLKGKISLGNTLYHPRLNLRSVTFATNQCNCRQGREGIVCAHAIALCLKVMENTDTKNGATKNEDEQSQNEPTGVHTLVISKEKGLPLALKIFIPPNLERAAANDAIPVKIEIDIDGTSTAPEKLDRGRAYKLSEPTEKAFAWLETLCHQKPASFLQIKRQQLTDLIKILAGEPSFYWINRPNKAIAWESDKLPNVSEHLEEKPAESKAVRPTPSPKPVRKSRNSDEHRTPTEIDGSTQYLAITLPSKNDPHYDEILALLKNERFSLEPANRKWWLRDKHKTLNFLSEYWDDFKTKYKAHFTENFNNRTKNLRETEVSAEAGKLDEKQFKLRVKFEAGANSAQEMLLAVARGENYLENDDTIHLVSPKKIQNFTQLKQALSGRIDEAFTPEFERTIATPSLRDVEELLEPIAKNFAPPQTWAARSGALKSIAYLVPPPLKKELDDRLRNYQRIGVAWLIHLYNNSLGGILADEMGLGKTIQALAFLTCATHPLDSRRTNLVVCPASLVENWKRECERFTPELRSYVHHGPNRHRDMSELLHYDLVITSYGTLSRDSLLFDTIQLNNVIADEAQHIKNRRSLNAQALRNLDAHGRFLLTGTPIENSIEDLRSLFEFLMPGYFAKIPDSISIDDREWFQQRHRQQAAHYILRRSKAFVAPELPEKIEQVFYCKMSPAQEALYKKTQESTERAIFDLELSGASENKVRFAALSQLLRLRQACAEPRLLDNELSSEDSCKLQAFEEILDESLDGNHRILVFSQFTQVLSHLRTHLEKRGLDYCYLDGHTRNRLALCDRFNENPSIPVFLISLKAGGTGLNLTGADRVVHFDPWWNPAVEAQATDRAHRIGQNKIVTSIKLIVSGTVEEKIVHLQQSKTELLRELLEASDSANATISLKEIKDLLA